MRPVMLCLAVLIALTTSADVVASDLAKEQRWAAQIVDALLDGEAVYLDDGRAEFLAIETEPMESAVGAAIVMHGTGVHPNWPGIVYPLRVGLAENGWLTLSIQMPVLANEAEHADYAKIYDWVPGRIDAAVRHLRDRGADTVVLIAHSQGATMAAYYLAGEREPVDAFVAVGMSAGIRGGPMDTLAHLAERGTPTLDLYGSEDLDEVVETASARAEAARKADDAFSQQVVDGADHFFEGDEAALLATVLAWLDARFR